MKRYTRREVLGAMSAAAVSTGVLSAFPDMKEGESGNPDEPRPNVILMLIDDQGYGDLGCMGNTKLRTPNIDRLFHESVWFPNFYVCPLCSPTRSSLMTGRYNYRTGVVDTSTGLAMMRPDEITIAQILSGAGYRTGIFGKWHLGDHYPLRPMDRGFHETLVCKQGMITGVGNPLGDSMFNPTLYHNGQPVKTQGYTTDVQFGAAIKFIEANRSSPFFVYIPTDVVHEPLQVSRKYSDPFKAMGLDDYTAKLYGEVVNLDENIKRLRTKLEQLGLVENTVLIYLSDNGPAGPPRYNLGLRGGKGVVYEGGIKVPFFAHWQGKIQPGRKCEPIAAHIDILPTILEMCGVEKPRDLHLDGRSLLPLMEGPRVAWPERMLFFQQSRPDHARRMYWDEPRLFTDSAVRSQRYKIDMVAANRADVYFKPVSFQNTELYNIERDPGEKTNIAHEHPEIVQKMRQQYEVWFHDVIQGINPPVRNALGSRHENQVMLTSQDLRGPRSALGPHLFAQELKMAAEKKPRGFGYWAVEVVRDGSYRITMRLGPLGDQGIDAPYYLPLKAGEAFLRIGEVDVTQLIPEGAASVTFNIALRRGKYFLDAFFTGQRETPILVSPFYVDVECLEVGRT